MTATYSIYATKADLVTFTGIPLANLPVNVDTLLTRANDLVTNSIMIIIIPLLHNNALKLAVCSQVEYWMNGGTDINFQSVKSYSAASVTVAYADDGKVKPLCPLARSYLNKEGLLYRGARTSARLRSLETDDWA